jgi:superfamily II DNA or RNA helicase
MIQVSFDRGTIVAEGLLKEQEHLFPYLKWDERVQKYRAQAFYYRDFILTLRANKINHTDKAKNFSPREFILNEPIIPRVHQTEALNAWLKKGSRGQVILPTGAGKTILAVLAIAKTNRPTLVHVPTLDLMYQWVQVLKRYFNIPIGMWGGGEKKYTNHNRINLRFCTFACSLQGRSIWIFNF